MNSSEALRVIYQGSETHRLEYKRSVPWDGHERFKLVKTIVGLANAGGGYLAIGVNEDLEGDNRFVGTRIEDIAKWDITNVSRDVNNYFEPDIDLELTLPKDEVRQKTFVLVRIPPHGSIPYICKKDLGNDKDILLRCGALYYRNRNKEITEIGRLDDWRDLIQRLTKLRISEIRQMITEILNTFEGRSIQGYGSKFNLEIESGKMEEHALSFRKPDTLDLPLLIFTAVPVEFPTPFEVEKSKEALKSASIDYSGWPYMFYLENSVCPPQFDENGIWALNVEPFFGRPTFYYWRFRYSNGLFFSAQITPESSVGMGSAIDAYNQAKLLGEILISVGRLYEGLGLPVDNQVMTFVKYSNLSKADIRILDHTLLPRPYSGTKLTVENRFYQNELLARPWNLSAEIVYVIGQRMGADRPLPKDFMEGITRKHLAKGQKTR